MSLINGPEVSGTGHRSASGVFLADDFRDNLIIDRYDQEFIRMRRPKLEHMRSENSEDAVSWNVFRTFRQIDPGLWLGRLMELAFVDAPRVDRESTSVALWKTVCPPPSLTRVAKEGNSEIDVVIESPEWVLFLEAKLKSDISIRTTMRPDRDQLLRNIDVGSHFAGPRDFYFGLICLAPSSSPKGAASAARYSSDRQHLEECLPHRLDGLANLKGIGLITWSSLASLLAQLAAAESLGKWERGCAERCVAWLGSRGITTG